MPVCVCDVVEDFFGGKFFANAKLGWVVMRWDMIYIRRKMTACFAAQDHMLKHGTAT